MQEHLNIYVTSSLKAVRTIKAILLKWKVILPAKTLTSIQKRLHIWLKEIENKPACKTDQYSYTWLIRTYLLGRDFI